MRIPLALAAVASFLFAPIALAGDPPPAAPGGPAAPAAKKLVMATPEEAAEALAKFKEDYKAKGLKGEDRLSQKDFAMSQLVKLQHPQVVEALAGVTRESDATLRMLGTIYLGDEKLLPGLAGQRVVQGWKRAPDDDALAITAMQSIARLKFLGAKEELRGALKDLSFAVKKSAISTIAVTEDIRLVSDILALVGTQLPSGKDPAAGGQADDPKKDGSKMGSGGAEVVSEGYSWEGAEAVVDHGYADNTAENAEAEAKVKEQIAKNQAEAQKAASSSNSPSAGDSGGSSSGPDTGGGGGGGGGSVSGGAGGGGESAPGRGGGGRSTRELLPYVLGAIQRITGKTFSGPGEFKRWWTSNPEIVSEKWKACDEKEKHQKAEAAAQSKAK